MVIPLSIGNLILKLHKKIMIDPCAHHSNMALMDTYRPPLCHMAWRSMWHPSLFKCQKEADHFQPSQNERSFICLCRADGRKNHTHFNLALNIACNISRACPSACVFDIWSTPDSSDSNKWQSFWKKRSFQANPCQWLKVMKYRHSMWSI